MKLALTDIKPNPANPRFIKDDKFKKLVQSLKDFPEMAEVREIVVNKDHVILGGNMRFKAMQEAGWKEAPTKVVDWPEDKQKQFVIKDNVSGGEWDFDILANEWDAQTLDDWGLDLPAKFGDEDVEEDEAPEVNSEPPISKLGETYQLGNHKVYCGDCKDLDFDKANLLVTDPPYGVSYADKNEFLNSIAPGNRNQTKIENDHQTPDEMKEFWTEMFGSIFTKLEPDATFYITSPQGGELLLLLQSLYDIGYPSRHMIIWAKNNHVLGRCDYNYKHEPILYGWLDKHKFIGGGKQKTSVWEIDKPHSSKEHPTMKPIELFAECILNSSEKGQIVLDPFLGSGTTLIACEQLDRICYGSELSPAYTDVIRKRYAKFISPENWEDTWEQITPAIA